MATVRRMPVVTRPVVPEAWKARVRVLGLLGALLVAALVLRMFQLQVVQGGRFAHRATVGSQRSETIETRRGRVYDRAGRLLATNEPRYALWVLPSELRNGSQTVEALARLLGVDADELRHRLQTHDRHPDERFLWWDGLDARQFARLAEVQPGLPGITLGARPLRRYPFGMTASHLLGTVGEISEAELTPERRHTYAQGDVIGKTGLERQYESELRGKSGLRHITQSAEGRTIGIATVRPFEPGADLHLTVDMKYQQRVEDILQETLDQLAAANGERTSGAVVVLKVDTGEVLAMASLPQFDPNLFSQGISEADYTRLVKDPAFPLLNRTITATYPPGSTFKLVTAAASLQEHVATADQHFHCTGVYMVAGQAFHCFVRTGHGDIDFINSISQSCDVVFYELGARLGIERLAHYAQLFGIGRPTGVDLPDEDGGLLPGDAWKRKALHEPWYDGDTVNMAIGQGYLAVSPLQMAVVTAAVANGGQVWQPFLVQRAPHCVVQLPVSEAYLAAIREGMRGTVSHGTATLAQSRIVPLAGKTGTAENYPTQDNPHGRNHAWFVGFAPADHPQLAVTVLLEKSGGMGGKLAAPIARRVIESWYTDIHPESRPKPQL